MEDRGGFLLGMEMTRKIPEMTKPATLLRAPAVIGHRWMRGSITLRVAVDARVPIPLPVRMAGALAVFAIVGGFWQTPSAYAQAVCPGILFRRDVEGADGLGLEGIDGPLVELVRALEDPSVRGASLNTTSYNVTFWEPGPSKAELDAWYASDCDTCLAPAGFDEIDEMIEELDTFVQLSQSLLTQDFQQTVTSSASWSALFYDPAGTDDYYDKLDTLVNGSATTKGITGWKSEIEQIRTLLPSCSYGALSEALNAPCQDGGAGTIDADPFDEFAYVQDQLDALIAQINAFRNAALAFYDDMQAIFASLGSAFGGVNPVTYAWGDSRGNHTLEAETSDFKLARLKKKKSGNFFAGKICMVLTDFSDTGANTWIQLTRADPVGKKIGMWSWNPFSGSVTKKACVRYSFDDVGLASCP